MPTRLAGLLPRLLVLISIWVFGTSTLSLAGSSPAAESDSPPPVEPAPVSEPDVLVVPNVLRQPYVFAKGILDENGFAWTVGGKVEGFAANLVATQSPLPGTRVLDTGAPTIVLGLERNEEYAERGLPEQSSHFEGSDVVLAAEVPDATGVPPPADDVPAAEAPADEPDVPTAEKPATEDTEQLPPAEEKREPAFVVPGAPPEPLDEIPLPDRARLLEKYVAGKAKTPSLVHHWFYQHAWIVTGAEFGWSKGAEALRILIRIDEDLGRRWGIGAKSEATARATLAEVERRSR